MNILLSRIHDCLVQSNLGFSNDKNSLFYQKNIEEGGLCVK